MSGRSSGKRGAAGRRKGSSVYGESARAIRVPESMLAQLRAMLENRKRQFQEQDGTAAAFCHPAADPVVLALPLFTGKVAAGFPSPADDYVEKTLDLNELLVQKPAATFFVRAEGESMLGAGIHPDDILVVDRSIDPVPGKVVICALNGELTVKRLKSSAGQLLLAAENPDYQDIPIHEDVDLVIWGVVTNVIHSLS